MKQKICFFFLSLSCFLFDLCFIDLPLLAHGEDQPTYMAKFGDLRLFFYNNSDKSSIARELIEDVSFRMVHGISLNKDHPSVPLVTPLAVLYSNSIAYDEYNKPIFADPMGSRILADKARILKDIIDRALKIDILSCSHDMSLVLNFDGLKFQQDNFEIQYKPLQECEQGYQKYFLVKDLTIIDWEMAKGTFSSTVIQDPESEDRFILPLFPKEIFSGFFVEPLPSISAEKKSEFSNTYLSTLQCITPPIDWLSSINSGSAKGKNITFSLKGVVDADQIAALDSRSAHLLINRGQKQENDIQYPTGLLIRQLPEKLHINRKNVRVFPACSEMEIFETNPEDNFLTISVLKEIFHLSCPINAVIVKHLTKKGSGFSNLNAELLSIPKGSHIIILNNSEIPDSCRHYHLAQDFRKNGLPWVQLYHLPPSMAMLLSSDGINDLSLTPAEEIFYRQAEQDRQEKLVNTFQRKISSKIDLFIFPND